MKITKHKLGRLCDIQIGRTPARANAAYWGEGHPWLSIADMSEKYVTRTKEEITQLAMDECNCKLVPKGSLLMSFKLSIGKVAITQRAMFTNEAIAALLPKTDDLDVEYLYYALKNYNFGSLNVAAKGATLNKTSLAQLSIPIPNTHEDQRRIATLLSRAEGLIAQRKESIRLLDELVRSVFLESFGTSNPKRAAWKVERLEKLASGAPNSIRSGPFGSDLLHSEFVEKGIAVLGIDNAVQNRFAWGQLRYITPEKYEGLKRYTVSPGDVLITIMATNGRSAVVPEGIPTAINSKHLACISLDRTRANPYFISYSIHSDPHILGQVRARHRGAIMTGLNLSLIKSLKFSMPSIKEQGQFADLYNSVEKIKETYATSLAALEQLYGSLSQRAFRGELKVSAGGSLLTNPPRSYTTMVRGVSGDNGPVLQRRPKKKQSEKKPKSVTLQGGVWGNVSGEQFKPEFTREVIQWARLSSFTFAQLEDTVRDRQYKYTYEDLVKGVMDGLSAKPPFLIQEYSDEETTDAASRVKLTFIG